MGLEILWNRDVLRDAECARGYRALRALAITRSWLGAHVDDPRVLDVFRVAAKRLAGAQAWCAHDDESAIDGAITRHFYEIDPRPLVSIRPSATGCVAATLSGPRGPLPHSPLAPARRWEGGRDARGNVADDQDVIGALANEPGPDLDESDAVRPEDHALVTEVWVGNLIFMVFVARRGEEWRVIDVEYGGQVELDTFRRG